MTRSQFEVMAKGNNIQYSTQRRLDIEELEAFGFDKAAKTFKENGYVVVRLEDKDALNRF